MGAYRDKKRNSWYANFAYVNHEGNKKMKLKRGFATKHDALAFEEEFLQKYENGVGMTMENFINEIYLPHLKQTVKQSSYKVYVGIINRHIIPSLGNYKLDEIDDETIIQWQNEMLQKDTCRLEKFKKSSLNTINCKLSSILNYADKLYGLKHNPVLSVKSIGNCRTCKEMQFWTLEQYKKVRELLMVDDSPLFVPIEVLFWTGIRRGELQALCVNDIDVGNNSINISKTWAGGQNRGYSSSPKTKSSYRKIVIPTFLSEEIKWYKEQQSEMTYKSRIFPLTSYSITTTLQKYAMLAGVPVIRVHDLRHSHVSLLIGCGYSVFDIAKRLGHDAVDVTYRYAHLHPRIDSEIVKSLDEMNEETTENTENN